ncbi:MAG: response regulator [Defluviitaleaceae bacterium]|nr:response regulator [Defluviitaleaceae bacterium]
MTLNLLITDDETLDREGLARQLNWEDYSIGEVYKAKDGPSALEILRKNKIDILLSDIKMPLMSGIELAQYARQIHPSIQIVFVSGYDDFMYAKMAIKINVYEYILKPVDTEELAACVTNLVERVKEQKREQEQQGILIRVASEGMPLLRSKLMLDLLFGAYNNIESRLKDMNVLQGVGWLAVLLIELDDYHIAPNENTKKMEDLQKTIGSLAFDYDIELVQIEESRLGLVISASSDAIPHIMEEAIVDFSKEILARITPSFSVSVGIGGIVGNYRELSGSYNKSVQALLSKQPGGKGKVLLSESAQDDNSSFNKIEYEIADCVKQLDSVKAMHLLDYLFKGFEKNTDSSPQSIQYYCVNIINQTELALGDFNIKAEDLLGSTGNLIQHMLRLETISNIYEWLKGIIWTAIDLLDSKRKSMRKAAVDKVISYVESHYMDNISLEKIAKSIYYTPNYLGNVFKQETNQNFSKYLMEYRIRQSAVLLQDRNVKVLEASMSVGYKNMSTFIKNFKSVFGVTPSEYRKFV